MEEIGLSPEELQQRLIVALLGFAIVFTILSPLMGGLLHRVVRRYMPEGDHLALLATALVIFLLSFAIVMGVLLRFGPAAQIGLGATLLISSLVALIITVISALLVGRGLERARQKIDPAAQVFSVWDEDARERRKNLRRR
jgi:hypothetical protein